MDDLLTKQDRLRQQATQIANKKADADGKKNYFNFKCFYGYY